MSTNYDNQQSLLTFATAYQNTRNTKYGNKMREQRKLFDRRSCRTKKTQQKQLGMKYEKNVKKYENQQNLKFELATFFIAKAETTSLKSKSRVRSLSINKMARLFRRQSSMEDRIALFTSCKAENDLSPEQFVTGRVR